MTAKHSKSDIKKLIEAAVADVCGLPRSGLWFCVNEVEASAWPPAKIRVWATLHFAADGSPFCCGEPQCHLGLLGERLADVGQHIQRAMHLRQVVSVEFRGIAAEYHSDVTFHYGDESAQ